MDSESSWGNLATLFQGAGVGSAARGSAGRRTGTGTCLASGATPWAFGWPTVQSAEPNKSNRQVATERSRERRLEGRKRRSLAPTCRSDWRSEGASRVQAVPAPARVYWSDAASDAHRGDVSVTVRRVSEMLQPSCYPETGEEETRLQLGGTRSTATLPCALPFPG